MASSSFLSSGYLKYIIIAVVLAAASQALTAVLLETVIGLQKEVAQLDKEVAVMDERVDYFAMIAANTQALNSGGGGYNAAEPNVTAGDRPPVTSRLEQSLPGGEISSLPGAVQVR